MGRDDLDTEEDAAERAAAAEPGCQVALAEPVGGTRVRGGGMHVLGTCMHVLGLAMGVICYKQGSQNEGSVGGFVV